MKGFCYFILCCLPLLLSCQSNKNIHVGQTSSAENLYLDDKFIAISPAVIETEQEIFKLDDDMRAMVQAKLVNNLSAEDKTRILLEHLFNEENIALRYEGNANVTATEAYHSKTANCMSLTIMAYALAKEAGMNISFQEVDVPEYWVRNGQYSLLTGHVNLLVKERDDINRRVIWGGGRTLIDFDPFVAKKRFPSHIITKNTLMAMFYNNKGAEALVNKNYPLAYQYLKEATLIDNSFASSWGNLGILYKLSGHYNLAEKAYIHAINLEEDSLSSLGNLALLLKGQGRLNEALPIENYIHKIRVNNPYYHALLADEAYFRQSYPLAIQHYKKAIQLDDGQHEFYFGLAKVYYKQDKLILSKKAMKKALVLTRARSTKKQYIAKLNFLKYQETIHH
jgi:tetratricopeptide (TPR) repeat protein